MQGAGYLRAAYITIFALYIGREGVIVEALRVVSDTRSLWLNRGFS